VIAAAAGGYLNTMEPSPSHAKARGMTPSAKSAPCWTDRVAIPSVHLERLSLASDVIDAVVNGSHQACSDAQLMCPTPAQIRRRRRRNDNWLGMTDE
jgi:hypothetical protein